MMVDGRRSADMCALYRMFDLQGRLLYVGVTTDLGQRMGDHLIKRWATEVSNITVEWLPHRAAALVAERRAIQSERPRYNRAGLQPTKADIKKQAAEIERQVAERKQREIEERRKRLDEKKQRIAEEERRIAEERERLIREQPGRDLLADLDGILGQERIRLADIPALLRGLAPAWPPYRTLTGVKLRDILTECGVRTTNVGNVPRLDPTDLRRVYRKAA